VALWTGVEKSASRDARQAVDPEQVFRSTGLTVLTN